MIALLLLGLGLAVATALTDNLLLIFAMWAVAILALLVMGLEAALGPDPEPAVAAPQRMPYELEWRWHDSTEVTACTRCHATVSGGWWAPWWFDGSGWWSDADAHYCPKCAEQGAPNAARIVH